MLMMVIHTSVVFCGGQRPKPMHSMCEIDLNSAHEYCVPTVAFCNKGMDVIIKILIHASNPMAVIIQVLRT